MARLVVQFSLLVALLMLVLCVAARSAGESVPASILTFISSQRTVFIARSDDTYGLKGVDVSRQLSAFFTPITYPLDEIMPGWSPDSNRRVFMSNRGGQADIYMADADGSNARNLTNHPANDTAPSFSPDGSLLAFVSDRQERQPYLYWMESDGRGVHAVLDFPVSRTPAHWSPDGRYLAFQSAAFDSDEIYVLNIDSGEISRLTENVFVDGFPAWSPDGRQIAFFSNRDNDFELYVMNADGGDVRRLTNSAGADTNPVWSPDGQMIAFVTLRHGSYNAEIYLMDANGANQRRLTDHLAHDFYPTWQP